MSEAVVGCVVLMMAPEGEPYLCAVLCCAMLWASSSAGHGASAAVRER